MTIHELRDEKELEEVLGKYEIALLDFWAKWCPPCKEFYPVFEAAAEKHPDIAFCRVDTDEAKPLQKGFEVHHIPTLVVIRERVMLTSQAGYLPDEGLEDLITKARRVDMDALRKEMADEAGAGGSDG
jgi:thioredoxin 1